MTLHVQHEQFLKVLELQSCIALLIIEASFTLVCEFWFVILCGIWNFAYCSQYCSTEVLYNRV